MLPDLHFLTTEFFLFEMRALLTSPFVLGMPIVLALVSFYLIWVWLKWQPRHDFLCYFLAVGLTLFGVLISEFPPAGTLFANLHFAIFGQIGLHAAIFISLALAPTSADRVFPSVGQLLKNKTWLFAIVFAVLAISAAIDMQQIVLPNQVTPFLVWASIIVLTLILALVNATRFLRAKVSEMAMYSFIIGVSIGASYAMLFMNTWLHRMPIVLALGSLIYMLLRYHEEHVKVEAELRSGLYTETTSLQDENTRLNEILEFSQEAIIRLERDEKVNYCSAYFARLFDKKPADFEHKKLIKSVDRGFYDDVQPIIKAVLRNESPSEIISFASRPDTFRSMAVCGAPIKDTRNKIVGIHMSLIDLTELSQEQKTLQQKLQSTRQQADLLREAVLSLQEAAILCDAKQNILLVNRAFTHLTGYAPDELLGLNPGAYFVDNQLTDLAAGKLKQQKNWHAESTVKRRDASRFPAEIMVEKIENGTTGSSHFLWMHRDVSERNSYKEKQWTLEKQIQLQQNELQDIEDRFVKVLSVLQGGIIFLRPDGACGFMNRTAEQLLSTSKDHLNLTNLPDFVRDLLRLEASYGSNMQAQVSDFKTKQKQANGQTIALKWRGVPVSKKNGKPLGVVLEVVKDETPSTQPMARQTGAGEGAPQLHVAAAFVQLVESVRTHFLQQNTFEILEHIARTIGWPVFMFYQKDHRNDQYDLLHTANVASRIPREMKQFSARKIEPYFQSRFACDGGYFLDTVKLPEKGATWEFCLPRFRMQENGNWQSQDVAAYPIRVQERTYGLLLLGEPTSKKKPPENELKQWKYLVDFLAGEFSEREQKFERERDHIYQNALLNFDKLDTSRLFYSADFDRILQDVANELKGGFLFYNRAQEETMMFTIRERRDKFRIVYATEDEQNNMADFIQKFMSGERAIDAQTRNKLATLLNLEKENLACALIPLRSRRDHFGFFLFARPSYLDEKEQQFLKNFTKRLSSVLETSRLINEIETKAIELESANLLISEFLANVSHELRTPLHAILSYVEVLRQKNDTPIKQQTSILETIQRSGKKLLYLINDLLDLSKIEAGKIEPVIDAFAPAELFQQVEQEIRPLCEQKGLNLKINLDKSLPNYAKTDHNILERVLLNLLRNAQKFTPKGSVTLQAKLTKTNVLIVDVVDTGVGIPNKYLQQIFEPFRQVPTKGISKREGTGLGLAISKKLIKLLDGNLEVKSTEDRGTTFSITLPVQVLKRKPKNFQSAEDAKPAKIKKRRKSAHILLVDDDESTREAMQFLLENAGYKVSFAANGEEAISTAQRLRPDLILLDVMMPGMDGYQTTRVLKSQKQLKHIPVVALTARAMQEDRQKAQRAGCDGFLSKPFEMNDFIAMVHKHT